MHRMKIPFNIPHLTGKELEYIREAHDCRHLSGDGQFTEKCQAWLEERIGCQKALLAHSCTGALEMAAILAAIKPGDEVIMPSFTFVSTANAFVLRGGVPVFVDIRPDTLNINETRIEPAITDKTKAIVPVHYASVGCELTTIMDIAKKHNIMVIEDAAQAIMARFKGRPLGGFGHLACLSFHETKNLISGEGGALLINDPCFIEQAEIIREKGTNRSKFFRGEVDKYTWVEIGSSYLPSDITAAFLWAQMENADSINRQRLKMWDWYHKAFAELENRGTVRRPKIPTNCEHNAHMYYLLLPDLRMRNLLLEKLKRSGILAVFHYVPLHSSPAGVKYGRTHGSLTNTVAISDRLLRLPLWMDMTEDDLSEVVRSVYKALS
jgi:dTDP-4-amino-4,6-dideoxygalactose transaminase